MSLKEKMCREIADKTVEFYMSGMSYEEAFEKAKEFYGVRKKSR